MCIELFINHALLFVSNCTVANMSNVSDTFDMAHVYETFTTVAPFITETNTTYNSTYNITDTTDTAVERVAKPTHPIYGPYVYIAIIGPVFVLTLIWCVTAYARAHCTPCKPKKPKKPNESCCKSKKPKKPKKPNESCCCKPKKVEPIISPV